MCSFTWTVKIWIQWYVEMLCVCELTDCIRASKPETQQGLPHRFTFSFSPGGKNRQRADSFPGECATLRFALAPRYQVLPHIKFPTGISVTAWHFIFTSGRYKIGRRSVCWIHFPRPSHCKRRREANPGNHFGRCVNADSTECIGATGSWHDISRSRSWRQCGRQQAE